MTTSNDNAANRRDRRQFLLLAGAGVALTLVTGAVYGRWTQRWGPSVDMQAAAARLVELPSQIGDWQLLEERPMSPLVVETLQCAAHVNRVYVNAETGEQVTVAIVLGPPGPIAVHTPEICYSSAAFEIVDSRREELFDAPDGPPHSLWLTTFKSRDAGSQNLLVYYGWTTGDRWQASSAPRFEYGGQRKLYKIQAATLVGPTDGDALSNPCRRFLEALLGYWQTSEE